MNFTTKSRYAVNALADLEFLSLDSTPVALKDIAKTHFHKFIRQDLMNGHQDSKIEPSPKGTDNIVNKLLGDIGVTENKIVSAP